MDNYTEPKLLRVIFEAPLDLDPTRGLAVAIVAGRQVLIQVNDETGPHSVLMPFRGAIALVMALCASVEASNDDLARFRELNDTLAQQLPALTA